jgi:hypothetical protein
MVQGITRFLTVAVLAFAAWTPAIARPRQIDATPFAHSPCSVLSDGPCTPYYCSPLSHGPCIPEIDYPYGENLQVTILSKPDAKDAGKYEKPDHDLDTISDLFAALRACWTPPPDNEARADMQLSVKLSFKRDGSLFAPPRLTYATHGVSADLRDTYLDAVTSSLDHCAPLSLTKGLGNAIAGRPIMIRYVDNRTLNAQQP